MAEVKEKSANPSRPWRIVLIASLALNLAVAGIVLGTAFSGRMRDGPPRDFDFGLGPISRALEPEDRRAIGRSMRRDANVKRLNLRSEIAVILDTLRTDPFDAAALRALVDRQNAQLSLLQARAQSALLDRISAMTPAHRADFADRLEQELSRGRDRRN